MSYKVKLIAIAKDEAAYLPEWIFHHLYFGFDEIEVLINRTTDNTDNVLKIIGKTHTNVKYRHIDWIDLTAKNISAHIQHIAYAEAYSKNQDDFTHIIFLDIDEFWTPINFSDSIQDCLGGLPISGGIYFEWLTEVGHSTPFSPLAQCHQYRLSRLGKTIVNTQCPLLRIDIHKPLFKTHDTLLADGQLYVGSESEGLNHQFVSKDKSSIKRHFVIHRMSRSEDEYLSMIYNGIPEEKGRFKTNRSVGYDGSQEGATTISFDAEKWKDYSLHRAAFFSNELLDLELTAARSHIEQRFRDALSALPEALKADHQAMSKTLHGLNNPCIKSLL